MTSQANTLEAMFEPKPLSGVLSKAADFVWFGHSYVSSVPINQENRDGA